MVSKTNVTIGETQCAVKSTSYDKIVCTMGAINSRGSLPKVYVGNQASKLVSVRAKNVALSAYNAGQATDDQVSIYKALKYKNDTMNARVDNAVNLAGGLHNALNAELYNDALKAIEESKTKAFSLVSGWTATVATVQQAIAIVTVSHAFQSECAGGKFSTEESRRITSIAQQYDISNIEDEKLAQALGDGE